MYIGTVKVNDFPLQAATFHPYPALRASHWQPAARKNAPGTRQSSIEFNPHRWVPQVLVPGLCCCAGCIFCFVLFSLLLPRFGPTRGNAEGWGGGDVSFPRVPWQVVRWPTVMFLYVRALFLVRHGERLSFAFDFSIAATSAPDFFCSLLPCPTVILLVDWAFYRYTFTFVASPPVKRTGLRSSANRIHVQLTMCECVCVFV